MKVSWQSGAGTGGFVLDTYGFGKGESGCCITLGISDGFNFISLGKASHLWSLTYFCFFWASVRSDLVDLGGMNFYMDLSSKVERVD